jgi:hypothetical protein
MFPPRYAEDQAGKTPNIPKLGGDELRLENPRRW